MVVIVIDPNDQLFAGSLLMSKDDCGLELYAVPLNGSQNGINAEGFQFVRFLLLGHNRHVPNDPLRWHFVAS